MTCAYIRPYKGVSPTLGARVFLAPGCVVTGDVVLGDDVNVWFGAVMRGDVNIIRIGDRCTIQDGAVIHISSGKTGETHIAHDVVIGHQACVHGCQIGARSLIGIGATVLDGAVVESDAMVAAGALVPPGKRIPSGEVWAGKPARKLRDLTQADYDYITYDIKSYMDLAQEAQSHL
ncbi:MAG: gamma carbonic anhydrase family protein [Pseudomonadota bacterium]